MAFGYPSRSALEWAGDRPCLKNGKRGIYGIRVFFYPVRFPVEHRFLLGEPIRSTRIDESTRGAKRHKVGLKHPTTQTRRIYRKHTFLSETSIGRAAEKNAPWTTTLRSCRAYSSTSILPSPIGASGAQQLQLDSQLSILIVSHFLPSSVLGQTCTVNLVSTRS